ncbi:MAG: hypothetical protein HYR76_11065 [Ignavibacteria bacterium]|nr:hypothetical protein [Ignavibacteria bacterium]
MHILASLEKVIYKPTLCAPLETFTIKEFLSGEAFRRASFILDYRGTKTAISLWLSPKRTRSYPYARVYDTMDKSKRVTIIPFMKDEGKDGDKDFLQWDSVSFMSLLGVYVIVGYYKSARKNERERQRGKQKITKQEFDYKFLKQKLDELDQFKSDALHWNLSQLEQLHEVAERTKQSYLRIEKEIGVDLHDQRGIEKRIEILKGEAEAFKNLSRKLASSAQQRELKTLQPKERLVEEKATITIKNYLGGEYYLTVDELIIRQDKIFLVEKKHSERSALPSMNDIKDGCLKMILFANLSEVKIDGKKLKHFPVLGLTSNKHTGYCDNFSGEVKEDKVKKVFDEGKQNKFIVFLMNNSQFEQQKSMIDRYISSIKERKG